MNLSQPEEWASSPEWHPGWDGDWEIEQLRRLAIELCRQLANLTVMLHADDPSVLYFDVQRVGSVVAQVYVNRNEAERACFSVFAGQEEEEYHGESIDGAIAHIREAKGYLVDVPRNGV